MSTLKMSHIICMAEIVLINKYHLIVSHLVMLLHSLGFNILIIFIIRSTKEARKKQRRHILALVKVNSVKSYQLD